MHAYKHAYVHKYIYIPRTNIYIHTYMHTYINTYIHTYVHTTHVHTCTYKHTYVHTYKHTYVHTYIRTYRQTDKPEPQGLALTQAAQLMQELGHHKVTNISFCQSYAVHPPFQDAQAMLTEACDVARRLGPDSHDRVRPATPLSTAQSRQTACNRPGCTCCKPSGRWRVRAGNIISARSCLRGQGRRT